jgi:hypothetical protein
MMDNMRDIRSRGPFTCTSLCRVTIRLEALARPTGPAGDAVFVPLRIVGGRVSGLGGEKHIVGGADIAVMNADEKLVHNGTCVVADPSGNTILWYDGASTAQEGAYDDLTDGVFPPKIPSRLCVRIASTNPEWRKFNRKPLLGDGSFDGVAGVLQFVILSPVELSSARGRPLAEPLAD